MSDTQRKKRMSIQFKFEQKAKVTSTTIEHIDKIKFYNLINDISVAKVIIDVREKEEYDLSHARAAISLPILSPELLTLNDLNGNTQFKMRGLLYRTAILYNETSDRDEDVRCLKLAQLLAEERKVDFVYILDKYTTFAMKYPFLCTTKDLGVAYNHTYPSEIVPDFLYLGDRIHSSTRKILDDLDITCILNMAEELENTFEGELEYCKLGVGDTLNDNIYPTLKTAVEFIQKAKKHCRKVLVHCNMGVSRSTTAVLAYLISENRIDFEQAFHFVKQQRPIVHPNESFKHQLIHFYTDTSTNNTEDHNKLL